MSSRDAEILVRRFQRVGVEKNATRLTSCFSLSVYRIVTPKAKRLPTEASEEVLHRR
jgi:hypothetical protein